MADSPFVKKCAICGKTIERHEACFWNKQENKNYHEGCYQLNAPASNPGRNAPAGADGGNTHVPVHTNRDSASGSMGILKSVALKEAVHFWDNRVATPKDVEQTYVFFLNLLKGE